jgi:glucosamine-6-phosphate deaminase
MSHLIKSFKAGKLNVKVFKDRESLGKSAANESGEYLINLLKHKEEIRIIFAASLSQKETLEHLTSNKNINWNKVIAFHMDEYIDIPQDAKQSLGFFLKKSLFNKLPFKTVHYINPAAPDTKKECQRYAKLLIEKTIDVVFLGIGENGHLAFNDPPTADFKDRFTVKTVAIDKTSKQQQVNEGNFTNTEQVPDTAYTITIPVLFSGKKLFCMVPGPSKSRAVEQTLNSPIIEACPATILRTHKNAELYLDTDSASELLE